VLGKGSFLAKMPGDDWQKFANVRLLFGYMYTQPGKKLLFMGGEIGQWAEWNHDASVEWHLMQFPLYKGLQRFVRDLNTVYRGQPALHQYDCDPAGFEWVDCCDWQTSVVSLMRKGRKPDDVVLAVLISRRCRDTSTGSASRAVGGGTRCSIATRRYTAAAGREITGASMRTRSRITGVSFR